MAVTYGFYNALEHDRLYDAIQMSSIFDGIIRDGIFSTIGESMVCKASGQGLVVNVGSGRAWFNHTWTLNDTDYPVETEPAEVVLDRIDAVVLEVNSAVEVRANTIKFIKGTPSSQPVRPTLIHNAEVNQYALAYVKIPAGKTTIFQEDITNVIGTDETPFITGLLQQLSIETIITQWEDEFNRYFTNFKNVSESDFQSWYLARQAEYAGWFAEMEDEGDQALADFQVWFDQMKGQLSEDAAGHLQQEIDGLREDAEKGSVVTITTEETTLENRSVTISQGSSSVTKHFDSNLVAEFPSVPFIGEVDIESTNGILTANGTLTIPYFGRYAKKINFWQATLNISGTNETLYGRTITISKDGTTMGTTQFDNTGHATYMVNSPGTYRLSVTSSDGITFTEDVNVTEETAYTVLLGAVDGKTALPTDDIQTWLHCAGIYDKNYTTLSQVLADNTTLLALISSSNAVDYMVRSTEWASSSVVGLVPKMTSDTTPSGVASGNSIEGTYYAYLAFDGDNTTYTGSIIGIGSGAIGSYIRYEFPSAKSISSIYVRLKNGQATSGTFKIQGSNDGNTFVDVSEEFTIATASDTFKEVTVSSTSSTPYKYFQLICTAYTSGRWWLSNLQFYSASGIPDNNTAMTYIGANNYCAATLLDDETWCTGICNSSYFEKVLNVKVPTMTSATTPSGVVSEGNGGTHPAWKAFDGSNDTIMESDSNVAISEKWVQYQFTKAIKLYKFKTVCSYENYFFKDFKIKGSNDGTTFTDLFSGTFDSAVAGTERTYVISSQENGAYNRFRIAPVNGYNGRFWYMNNTQFYGRAPYYTAFSAANDMVYYYKDGVKTTAFTTGADGGATVDWRSFTPGTYTFYSTIAKDPNNLSNPYTKQVTITGSSAQEVKIMPDKVGYWYGYEDEILNPPTVTGQNTAGATRSTNYLIMDSANGYKFYASSSKGFSQSEVTRANAIVNVLSGADRMSINLRNSTDQAAYIVSQFASNTGLQKLSVTKSGTPSSLVSAAVYASLPNVAGKMYVYAIWCD